MDVRDIRRLNLHRLVAEFDLKKDLAKRIHKAPSQVSQWLKGYRSIEEDSARHIEQMLRKPERWMDVQHLDAKPALVESTPADAGGVAHKVSLPTETVAPTVPWEQLKMNPRQLPAEFYVVLPDDSMAPVAPAGTKVKFDTRLKAMPGDAVLVAGPQGEPFFRELRALLGGAWEAHPSNKAYPVLHSEQHALVLLGVFVGIDRPWSALAR